MRPLLGQVRLACHDRHTTCCPTLNIETTLPVQLQHPLHGRYRHALGRRLSSPAVEQPAESELLIPLSPAPHMPVADAQDLGRLPPADLLRHRLQHHFLYFHRPLHGGLCVGVHAWHGPLPPPEKRTYHLLSQPDISCATDTYLCFGLTTASAARH